MSLLDHLLNAELEEGEKRLTSQELRDEVVTFLGAGKSTVKPHIVHGVTWYMHDWPSWGRVRHSVPIR